MGTHHERKSMRLPGYDYSLPGAYFFTVCTRNRECLFETPEAKLAVESAWHFLLDIYVDIELGEFVVMSNHVHGDIWITGEGAYRLHPGTWKNDDICRGGQLPAPTPPVPTDNVKFVTLSNIIGAFKTTAAARVNKLRGRIGAPVWQKSFYERIIRDERELEQIREYIRNNPIRWEEDRNNPASPEFFRHPRSIDDIYDEILDWQRSASAKRQGRPFMPACKTGSPVNSPACPRQMPNR